MSNMESSSVFNTLQTEYFLYLIIPKPSNINRRLWANLNETNGRENELLEVINKTMVLRKLSKTVKLKNADL